MLKREYLLLLIAVVLVIFVFSNCDTKKTVGSQESLGDDDDTSSCEKITLLTSFSDGIKSSIPPGTQTFDCPHSIQYDFELMDGYRNLTVYYDDNEIPSSGSISVEESHLLSAVASKIPSLRQETTPIFDAYESVIQGSKSSIKDNFQILMNEISVLYSENPDSAYQWITEMAQIIEESYSEEKIHEIETALSGELFEIHSNTSSASKMITDEDTIEKKTAVVYINGIWNSIDQAGITSQELHKLVNESGIENFESFFIYNPTAKPTSNEERVQCALKKAFFSFPLKHPHQWGNLIADCVVGIDDIYESVGQMISSLPPPGDAINVAYQLKGLLDRNYQIIVVAHSQGNLMIKDAVEKADIIPELYRKRIGIISLAAPQEASTSPESLASFDCWIIEKDIITITRLVGSNGCSERLNSDYSIYLNERFSELNLLTGSSTFGKFEDGPGPFALHSATLSYFDIQPGEFNGSAESKDRLIESLIKQQNDLYTAEDSDVPKVTTKSVTNIASNSANSGGTVESDGGLDLQGRGVCWSTSQNPTLNGNCTSNGSGLGEFTSSITGLNPDTEYFVRAYASNEMGTAYGNQKSFTTTDIEGSMGNWVRIADFGGSGRAEAVGFSIDGKGYIGLGLGSSGGQVYSDFWEYNPANGSWSKKADLPEGSGLATGFSIGKKGYILADSKFWEYDPEENKWNEKSSLESINRMFAVGFSIGEKGYIGLGGDNDGIQEDFWEYDPKSDRWTQKANFPGGKRTSATGFSIADKGYVGLGVNTNDEYLDDFWEYDPQTDTWTNKSDFAGDPRHFAVGFSIEKTGYIGTGIDDINIGALDDFWEYDPTRDEWNQIDKFDGGSRFSSVSFSIGKFGYVGTGVKSSGYQNDFWEFQPD